MTTNDYLDLLDLSAQVAYNPLTKTIEFMDKDLPIITVDNKVHEVNEDFNQALSDMPYEKPSVERRFIESEQVRVYLEGLLAKERHRKLLLLL